MRWIRQIFVPLLLFLGAQIGLLIVLAPRGSTNFFESETEFEPEPETTIPMLTETAETSEPEILVPRTVLPPDPSRLIVLPFLGPLFAIDVTGVFLLFRSLRNQEERFAEKVGALERSNRDLSDFAHTVSHDLQEPLRVIQTALRRTQQSLAPSSERPSERISGSPQKQISERPSEPPQERIFERIPERSQTLDPASVRPTIDHTLRLAADAASDLSLRIHDILERTRIDAAAIRPVRTDVAKVLDRVERNLSQAIEERGAIIQRGNLPILTVDPVWLEILLQNLIGNALRYGCVPPTGKGEKIASTIQIYAFPDSNLPESFCSGTPHPVGGMDAPWKIDQAHMELRPQWISEMSGVYRKPHGSDKELRGGEETWAFMDDRLDSEPSGVWGFAIVDHGPGMANLDSLQIFEPFRQGNLESDPRRRGYGIGLATSRRIVERHGGSIHIAATPGGGTTVWFTLNNGGL